MPYRCREEQFSFRSIHEKFDTSKKETIYLADLPKSKTMSLGNFLPLLQDAAAAIVTLSLSLVSAVMGRELTVGKNSMVGIGDLPVEVLSHIFRFLPAKDIASVSEVCRIFYEASHIESVWIHRCRKDFNIPIVPHSGFSYREVYTNVLHEFGSLIGLWQPQISSYGGLLEVHFDKGKLIGTELHPPLDPNIIEPLRKKPRFSVGLDEEKNLEILCLGGSLPTHKAEVRQLQKNEFSFKCCDVDSHRHPNGRHQGLMDWLLEESSAPLDLQLFPHSQELLLMKFLILHQYNFSYKYRRLHIPKERSNIPIQPGLFKGTYGAHGLELVMLDYEDDSMKVKALKISGDPNVPAGQVTFQVDLNYSMILNEEQQLTMAVLEAIEIVRVDQEENRPLLQPFKVPSDCFERFHDIPKFCSARYHAMGQIAGHGFTNPSFSRGHWVIFNEDLFGFLWLDLLSLSMYHRVKENLVYSV